MLWTHSDFRSIAGNVLSETSKQYVENQKREKEFDANSNINFWIFGTTTSYK